METMTFEKVTLFFVGAFGTTKQECKVLKLEEKPYAQYSKATYVTYVPRGARKERGFVKTDLSVTVLAGWNHPEPSSVFEPTADGGGQITRFTCFSPEWKQVHKTYMEQLKSGGAEVLFEN